MGAGTPVCLGLRPSSSLEAPRVSQCHCHSRGVTAPSTDWPPVTLEPVPVVQPHGGGWAQSRLRTPTGSLLGSLEKLSTAMDVAGPHFLFIILVSREATCLDHDCPGLASRRTNRVKKPSLSAYWVNAPLQDGFP